MREKFYPLHVRKDKSNEFARLEMGDMIVDEYYHKFMEYINYCPDDVPTEEKKMQRFELGLSFDIQKHIESVRNILRKEKEKEKCNVPEKRKEGSGSSTNSGFRGDAKTAKPLLDRDDNERKYFYRRCKRNIREKIAIRNLVECNFCHKRGHREYECYIKKGSGSQQPGGQHRLQNLNNSGRQVNLQYENGNHGNAAQRFQRPINGGQNRVEESRMPNRGAVNVLFDSGATCSFLAKSRVEKLNLGTFEEVSYTVSVPSGMLYNCNRLYKEVPLRIGKVIIPSNLYVLEMKGLEVLLGMDWLKKYKATIECREQRVSLERPRGEMVKYRKFPKEPKTNLVSTLKLQRLVRQGHTLYLCHIIQEGKIEEDPKNIAVVKKFLGVIPDKVPGYAASTRNWLYNRFGAGNGTDF
ncbi:uncharacterized protein LOC130813428 [Amaranthus tricolor]|uniref:uncharacterized protein LOC130813428 n=1 Tax=Amaranthus tricolor TaxID=29722 RepID=UPI002582D63F|nr:uncharacterized protein LOC130813428 [Amaranthus tricolor]